MLAAACAGLVAAPLAHATIARNSVGTSQVVDGSLTTNDVRNSTLTGNDVKNASLGIFDLAASVFTNYAHASGTLAARPAAATANAGYLYFATDENGGTLYRSDGTAWVQVAGSVTPTVGAGQIGSGVVTSDSIADESIVAGDIATGGVASSEILDASIDTLDLADGILTSAKIFDGTIATADLATGAVTSAKIADGTITASDIAQSAISGTYHASGTAAAMPAAAASNGGNLYFATDVNGGTLYRSNGSSWVQVALGLTEGGGGGGGAPSGAAGGDLSGTYPNPAIAADAVTSAKIADDTVSSADVTDDAISSADIMDDAIASVDIADGTIATVDLAGDSVTSAKIADGTVTSGDIADGTIATVDMAGDAVTSAKIADGTVASGDIADGTVADADIAQGAVSGALHASGTLAAMPAAAAGNSGDLYFATDDDGGTLYRSNGASWDQVAKGVSEGTGGAPSGAAGGSLSGTYPNPGIAAGAITTSEIAAGAVGTADLAAGAVDSSAIADGTIATVDIAGDAVTSAKIADGTIATVDLAADAVTSAKIADGTVSSADIADGVVASGDIADGTIDTVDLAGDAVTSAKIADGTIAIGDIAQGVWATSAHSTGTLAARPAAAASNNGFLYLATDVNGGTLYRSDGASWSQASPGVSEAGGGASGPAGGDLSGTYPNPAIAGDAVTSAKIADGAVASADIADGTVVSTDIADGTIATGDIAADAVTSAKIADGTVSSADIVDGTIATGDISDGTITVSDIAQSTWSGAVNQVGFLAGRPLAAAGNNGWYYLATDVNGGTMYRSNGFSWDQVGKGVSETATPAGAAGGDLTGSYPNPTIAASAVDITKIASGVWAGAAHQSGTLAARPPAAAGNNGYLYLATDVNGGTLFRSDGASWSQIAKGVSEGSSPSGAAGGDLTGSYPNPTIALGSITSAKLAGGSVDGTALANNAVTSGKITAGAVDAAAIGTGAVGSDEISDGTIAAGDVAQAVWTGSAHQSGTLAGMPAAAAANAGFLYFATDDDGGTLYRSDGAAWSQVAKGVTEGTGGAPSGPAGGDLSGNYPNPTIGAGAVTAASIAANTITGGEIGADAVGASEIAVGAVGASEISDGTVTSTDIADGTIASGDIADGTVASADISDGTIVAADVDQSLWSGAVHQSGLLAGRPIAAAGNAGFLYLATDVNGGTLYRSDGAAWAQVARGASEGSAPSGAAGGDLAGTYPNPTIASDAVTSAAIADGTISMADHAPAPSTRAYNNANIAIATGTDVALTFNSESFDTDTMHDTAVNSGRITATTGGLYLLTANIEWATSATAGRRIVRMRVNGATIIGGNELYTGAGPGPVPINSLSTIYRLNPGDYVEVIVRQNTGANLNVAYTAGEEDSPMFGAVLLAP